MLVEVPAPPWITSTTNSSSSAPSRISSQARAIALGALVVEQPELAVGERRGLLDAGERRDQVRVDRDRGAGDREVLQRPQRVHAVVGVGRHLRGRRSGRARCAELDWFILGPILVPRHDMKFILKRCSARVRPARGAGGGLHGGGGQSACGARGVEILRAGGSALDAAIAVQMVLNLVEPQSSGIGGGAFLLHWDEAQKKIAAYDGRETAPGRGAPGPLPAPRRHADGHRRSDRLRPLGRRARRAAHAGARARAARPPALDAAVRTGDPPRRGRIRRLAAPAPADRRRSAAAPRSPRRAPTSICPTAARCRSATG